MHHSTFSKLIITGLLSLAFGIVHSSEAVPAGAAAAVAAPTAAAAAVAGQKPVCPKLSGVTQVMPAGCTSSAVTPRRRVIRTSAKAPVRRAVGPQYLPVKPVTMVSGAIEVLPMHGKVLRVALGNGAVVSTTTVDSNLLLIAEQVGTTSLLVWTPSTVHSYRVEVVDRDPAELRARLDALITGMPKVYVQKVGSDLVLGGFAHKNDLARLAEKIKEYPGIILNVKEDLGSPFTRSVLFRLHFIEVKRSLLEKIGIDWAKEANGPVAGAIGVAKNDGVYGGIRQIRENDNLLDPVPQFLMRGPHKGGMFLGLATTITSRLNLGISDGDARVLASPELTAKSGGKAKLQVGGEVPIPLAGAFGAQTVEFKPYGILFAIEPHIDENDVITAKVSTELSQIDPSVSVAGIPGFITRNTSTEVSLKQGELVALSGLVNSEMSTAIDRVPGLSRIPIFGRLFRSDDFRNRKTELIVLLEPEIISPGDGLSQQLLNRGLTYKKEFEDKARINDKPIFPDDLVYPAHGQRK